MVRKYAVDQVIDDIIILEDLDSKERLEINKSIINMEIADGDIISFDGNNYKKDNTHKQKRLDIIKEKMRRAQKRS